jgi:hypothetical protein
LQPILIANQSSNDHYRQHDEKKDFTKLQQSGSSN